jgi:hypothetical protein
VGRLLLAGDFISRPLADALRIGEKKDKEKSSINYLYTQNKDVLCDPKNPVNPDSRQDAINIV